MVGGVDAFVDAAPNVDAAPTAGQVLHASTPDRGKGFILPSQTESQTVMQIQFDGFIYVENQEFKIYGLKIASCIKIQFSSNGHYSELVVIHFKLCW